MSSSSSSSLLSLWLDLSAITISYHLHPQSDNIPRISKSIKTRTRKTMQYIPAIAQFIPDIFQIGISHIIHTKHKTMLITIERFAHIGKEFERKLLSFLIDFGEMNDARALGFRHFDYVLWWWWLGERKGGVAEDR